MLWLVLVVLYSLNLFALALDLLDCAGRAQDPDTRADLDRQPRSFWLALYVAFGVGALVPGLAAAVMLWLTWRRYRLLCQVIHHQE